MIQTIKQNKKAVLAFLLAMVMVIRLIPFTATEAHAMTVDATGENVVWEKNDSFTLVLASKDDPTKTETHTVTYDGTNWSKPKSDILPAYAFAYIGDEVTNITYTDKWNYRVNLQSDQSTAENLAKADVMTATGEVAIDTSLSLHFVHYFAKVTFRARLASEFDSENDTITGFYALNLDEKRITAFHDGNNNYSVIMPSATYSQGSVFALVEVNGDKENPLKALVPQGMLTLVAGKHYTFDLKIGKDVVTLTPTSTNTEFPGNWYDNDNYDDDVNLNN